MSRLLAAVARHPGRHCRRGSYTGWALLPAVRSVARAARMTQPNITPLGVWPMAAPDYNTNSLESTR